MKPFSHLKDIGAVVGAVLTKYNAKDVSKQLIVVVDDSSTLAGSITVQDGHDLKGTMSHGGVVSIVQALQTTGFVRLRVGIGKPSDPKTSLENYAVEVFGKDDPKETDMFGFALDQTAQALQHLAYLGDPKKTKKKFASKKLPKSLRKVLFCDSMLHVCHSSVKYAQMEGLAFPIKIEEINKPEKKEGEEASKSTTEATD